MKIRNSTDASTVLWGTAFYHEEIGDCLIYNKDFFYPFVRKLYIWPISSYSIFTHFACYDTMVTYIKSFTKLMYITTVFCLLFRTSKLLALWSSIEDSIIFLSWNHVALSYIGYLTLMSVNLLNLRAHVTDIGWYFFETALLPSFWSRTLRISFKTSGIKLESRLWGILT